MSERLSRAQLVEKWDAAKGRISTKDISDPYVKENMAIILENQERKDWNGKELFQEAGNANTNITGLNALGYTFPAGTQDADSWKFRPIAMALFRRVFPDLFANKCCGVQAMNTPVGLAFALRMIYGDGSDNSGTQGTGIGEAAWDYLPEYTGYSGSSAGASAALDTPSATYGLYDASATGALTSAAEAWLLGTNYPQLKMRLDKVTIEAESRKLGASFSLESAQDIKAMQDIDIEREMLNVLQYEVLAELDRELLYRMKKASIDTSKGGELLTLINCSGTSALDGRWSQERYANIVAAIINMTNKIAVKTRRGAGNFCVASPSLCTILQASGHPFTRLHSGANASTTLAEIGVLNDTITVYRDVYARGPYEYAMAGFKGNGISDAGIIFSPYIMGLTSKAIDPYDFSPRIGVLSRYAITDSLLGSGRYYRTVALSNVNQILATA
jgi:hypothetical protein